MPTRIVHPTKSAYAYPLLIKHLLHTPLARSPDNEIVYRDLRRHTYRTFRERLGRLASALTEIGVEQGDVVAVLDWDSHRYLECYFAVPMMGAILQTVNVSLAPEDLVYALNDAGAHTILFNLDFLPLVTKIAGALKSSPKFVAISDAPLPTVIGVPTEGEYEEMLARSSPYFQFPDFDENSVATMFHTTGTTGRPKGVCFTHRQLVLHTLAGLVEFGLQRSQGNFHRDDVYMPMTPMFHVHAWGCPYTATLSGVKQVYPGRYVPENLLKTIQREGVTFTHCVPTILQMLLDAPNVNEVDLSHLKMVVGGSAMPASLARAAMARGIDVFAGYGLSEACPTLTSAHLPTKRLTGKVEEEIPYRTSAGMGPPLVELRVVNEDMTDVPHDGASVGEVVARAPWLTQCYIGNEEASEQLWSGGYLHTGDVATIDREGYLHITDRLKDVVKSGGEWISSLALESIILEMAGVKKVAVIGMRDVKWGERPYAIVVLAPEAVGRIDGEQVRRHVASYAERGVIPRLGIPDKITIVDDLPLTSIGKIDKKKLRATYLPQPL